MPGIADAETIGRLVKEVGAPVNVVMGLAGTPMSVSQLDDLGVKRVSIGGSLARATFGLIRRAATEIGDDGTFGYAEGPSSGRRALPVLRRPTGSNRFVTELRAMCGMDRGVAGAIMIAHPACNSALGRRTGQER